METNFGLAVERQHSSGSRDTSFNLLVTTARYLKQASI